MSCGCSNTTPITPTTNCGSCGYNCTNCTCPTNPIIEPVVVCADPEPCSELFPLECVIYTGPDIACTATAGQLYPNVLHHVVLQNSTTVGRNFVSILNNINAQLCYLFSKDYISQFLTNIKNDPTLSALFCDIASVCNCDCTLTCGTVTSIEYIVNTAPTDDTIDVEFTQSIGGTTKTFTGSISGTTLTISANPGSIVFVGGQKITGTNVAPNTFIVSGGGSSWLLSQPSNVSSQSLTVTHITYIVSIYQYINGSYYYLNNQSNIIFPAGSNTIATASIDVINTANDNTSPWLVSVFANDEFADPECTSGYNNNEDTETPVPVDYYDGCGFGMIDAVPPPDCPVICFDNCTSQTANAYCKDRWSIDGNGKIVFSFTHNPPLLPPSFNVTEYVVHWYKKVYVGPTPPISNVYQMLNPLTDVVTELVTVGPGQTQIFDIVTTIPPGPASTDQWLLLITPVTNTDCYEYFPYRIAPATYTRNEINDGLCNWFIY
jgi:hypothetical protein